jgi:hypothetical protein
MCIFADMNARYHTRNVTGTIIKAASGLGLLALLWTCASTALGGPPATHTYIGTDLWFAQMRKLPANTQMLRDLAHTNFVIGVPPDCVEVAGTINFPNGNPFATPHLPELQIYCRDQGVDAVARKPQLDDGGHFYTVFKRGQQYDFYWKLPSGRERFCSLQVGTDAQTQHTLSIDYPPAETVADQKPSDEFDLAGRERKTLVNEYDLSAFPANPTGAESQRVANAMRTATTTAARAAAHEMLAHYYADKGDRVRAGTEFKRAASLREGLVNEPPSTVIVK